MRGWLAVQAVGHGFRGDRRPLCDEEWDKRREGDEFAPSSGKVPILWDGDIVVWDSLAIIDYLADQVGRDEILARGQWRRARWRDRCRRKCTPASPICAASIR